MIQIDDGQMVTLTPEGVTIYRPRRQPDRVRRRGGALGRGRRREGRLRHLHAEGDPRAGRRGRRDDHRPAARGRPGRSLRGRPRPGVHRRRPADRHRRLRHQLPRRPGRPLRDRAVGAGPGGDGHRLGVPLPRPGRRPGRPRHRHHPVGRDARHPGRDAVGSRARGQGARRDQRDGQPGDPRRRRRPLHPRRTGDRGRGDQDLRQPGRRDVPARPLAGAAARPAARRRDPRADRRDEGAAAQDPGDGRHGRGPGRRRSLAPSTRAASSSTSAATSAFRFASRAR